MKLDLKSRVSKAADSSDSAMDRFERTEKLLKIRPTGFSSPIPTAEQEQSPSEPLAHTGALVGGGSDIDSLVTDPAPVSGVEKEGTYHAVIPIADIEENPFNARRIYRQERIEKLAVSIAAQKQIVPGIATLRDGKYVLVAGHYRLRAIRFSGGKTMEVMIHPSLTDQELYELSLKENAERDEQSAYDNALAWKDLLSKGIYESEDALASATGISLPNINKTLSITKLSDAVLAIVTQNPSAFGLSLLYELFLLEKVAKLETVVAVAEGILREEYTRTDIQKIRESCADTKQRKPRETSRHNFQILVNEVEVGSLKDFGDGRVLMNVTLEDPLKRKHLLDLLREHFGLT